MYKLWLELGTDLLEQGVVKTKNFLLSEILPKDEYNGMITYISGGIEYNPSIGLPSFLPMLALRAPGKLLVESDSLIFDDVEVGTTSELEIELQNSGESNINVTWNFLNGNAFSAIGSYLTVEDQETVILSIIFAPPAELEFTDEVTITSGNDEFLVSLLGKGFDIPELIIC